MSKKPQFEMKILLEWEEANPLGQTKALAIVEKMLGAVFPPETVALLLAQIEDGSKMAVCPPRKKRPRRGPKSPLS